MQRLLFFWALFYRIHSGNCFCLQHNCYESLKFKRKFRWWNSLLKKGWRLAPVTLLNTDYNWSFLLSNSKHFQTEMTTSVNSETGIHWGKLFFIECLWATTLSTLTHLFPIHFFSIPLKTWNLTVSLRFQMIEKGCIGNKWVNRLKNFLKSLGKYRSRNSLLKKVEDLSF